MYPKKLFYLVLVSSLWSFLVEAKGAIVNLKGMTHKLTCLDKNGTKTSQQLTPTRGALCWEGSLIINIYQFGQDDAIKRLINELFFVQPDGSLSATYSYTKIARYFTPELMGNLIGLIYQYQLSIRNQLEDRDFGGEQRYQAKKLFNQLITPQYLQKVNKDISDTIIKPFVEQNVSTVKATVIDGLKKTNKRYGDGLAAQKLIATENEASIKALKGEIQQQLAIAVNHFDQLKGKIKSLKAEGKLTSAAESQWILTFTNKFGTYIPPLLTYTDKKDFIERVKSNLDKFKGSVSELISKAPEDLQSAWEIVRTANEILELVTATSPLTQAIKENNAKIEEFERLSRSTEKKLFQESGASSERIINADFEASVRDFGSSITNALSAESSEAYPAGTVIDILLAFLWKKLSSVEEFDRYNRSVITTLGGEYVIQPTQELFTRTDYKRLKKEKDLQRILEMNFDELVFVTLGYNFYDNALPPHIPMLDAVFYRGIEFPDCGETSLRNLINALIYHNATSTFDIELLKKLGAVDAVIDYYSRYQSPEAFSLNEQESHNEWATVVSALPNVKYGKEGLCDIDPGITNMLLVINALFPRIKTFEDLIAELTKIDIRAKISSTAPMSKDVDNIVTLTIKKTGLDPFDLDWHFESVHFELKFPVPQEISFASKYIKALSKQTSFLTSDLYCLAHLGMSPNRMSWLSCCTASHAYIYLSPQFANKQKIKAVSHLLGQIGCKKDHQFAQHYLLAVNEKISRNGHIIEKLIDAVKKKNNDFEDLLCRAQKDSAGRATAIEHIIQDKKEKLYKWACSTETLKIITGEDAAALAQTILQQSKATDPQTNAFMKALYTWKPNLKGAETDDLLDLVLTLFVIPENPDSARAQFAEQFFDLELPENMLQTISSEETACIVLNLANHPLSPGLENKKLVQLLIRCAPLLTNKLSRWAKIILGIYLETSQENPQPANPILATLQQQKQQLSLSYDYCKGYLDIMWSGDYLALVKFLLKHPLTPEQEKSRSGKLIITKLRKTIKSQTAKLILYLFEHPLSETGYNQRLAQEIKRIMPDLLSQIDSYDIYDICKYLLCNDQENIDWLHQMVLETLPQLIEKIDANNSAKLILLLLEHPMTKQQEKGHLGKIIESALPQLISKIDEKKVDEIVLYVLQHPLEQIPSRLYELFVPILPNLMLSAANQNAEVADKVINYLLKHPLTPEQETCPLCKEIIACLPQLATKLSSTFCGSWQAILELIEHPMTPEQEASAFGVALLEHLPSTIHLQTEAAGLIKNCLQNVKEKEKDLFVRTLMKSLLPLVTKGSYWRDEELIIYLLQYPAINDLETSILGQSCIEVFPQLINNLNSLSSCTLIKFLLNNPLTLEQQQSRCGKILIQAIPSIVSTIDDKTTIAAIEYLLSNKINTQEQESSWIDDILLDSLPQLLKKYDKSCGLYLIKKLLLNPLSTEQEQQQIGQLIKGEITSYQPTKSSSINNLIIFLLQNPTLPETAASELEAFIIRSIQNIKHFNYSETIMHVLQHPLTPEQQKSLLGKMIIHAVPQIVEEDGPFMFLKLITILLQKPMTLELEQSDFGKAIIQALDQIIEKIKGDGFHCFGGALFCLLSQLLHKPFAQEQEISPYNQVVKYTLTSMTSRIKPAYPEYAQDLIEYLLKNPLTPEQEQHWIGQTVIAIIPRLMDEIDRIGEDYHRGANSFFMYLTYNPMTLEQEKTLFGQAIIKSIPKLLKSTTCDHKRHFTEYLLQNPESQLNQPEIQLILQEDLGSATKDLIINLIKKPITPEQAQKPFANTILSTIPTVANSLTKQEKFSLIKQISGSKISKELAHTIFGQQLLNALPLLLEKLTGKYRIEIVKHLLEKPMPHELEKRRIGKKIIDAVPEMLEHLSSRRATEFTQYLFECPLIPAQRESRLGKHIVQALPSLQERMMH